MIRSASRLLTCLLLLCLPDQGHGFYEYHEQNTSLEIGGFLGAGLGQLNFPADTLLYETSDDQPWSGELRLLIEAEYDGNLHLSANILQSWRAKLPLATDVGNLLPIDVERSGLLTYEQHDSPQSRAELLIDNLHLQYRTERLDLAIGRQPINLATTFYFVPNDFFAPFAPQTFFRSYKPGVDAIRADLRLAELTQLTALGVLSYAPDDSTANNWHDEPDWPDTSLLLRASREMAGFEWAILFGTVDGQTVSGGSLQGEIINRIGLRAEGHYSNPETATGASFVKLAVGLEKLYQNNFNWRLEYFRNGEPDPATTTVPSATEAQNSDYGALGLGYEVTPLLNSNFLVLAGFTDNSWLISVNLLYSLSDESEMALTFSTPFGDQTDLTSTGSEFGDQPRLILMEYRLYL